MLRWTCIWCDLSFLIIACAKHLISLKLHHALCIEMPPKLLYSKDQKKTVQPRCHVICLPLCHHDDPLHMHCWHKYATLINISEQSSSWGSRRCSQVIWTSRPYQSEQRSKAGRFPALLKSLIFSFWSVQSTHFPNLFKSMQYVSLVCCLRISYIYISI